MKASKGNVAAASALGLMLGGCYSGVGGFDPNAGLDGADSSPEAGDGQNEDGDGEGDGEAGDGGEQDDCSAGLSVGVAPLRRLTRFEYDNTVRDLLGDDARIAGSLFSTDDRSGGFAANASAPIGQTQLDEYAAAAEELSTSFVDAGLGMYIDCPLDDDACAEQFVTEFGRKAFRRSLADDEVADYLALYQDGRDSWDGATGLRLAVQSMLLSPNFLYHMELLPPEAGVGDVVPLDAYALASRTSYFLWASMPDDELLDAAEAGALDTAEGLEEQVRRMLEDPRAADAVGSFTKQWMHLESLSDKVKDAELFPQWNAQLADSMEREAVTFANEVVRSGDARLKTLLTASWTMADASLAGIYGVEGPEGPEGEFGRIELPPDERAGLLTQPGFLATNAHATETSWVHRGLFVRQSLLCQDLPAPPAGVEGDDPNDSGRLESEECKSCHTLIDPIGWAFDDYDAIGQFTDEGEAGEARSSSVGEFDDIVALGGQLAASPEVQDCVATQWFRYASRRRETAADQCVLDELKAKFEGSDQDIRELIVEVATSDAFRNHQVSE